MARKAREEEAAALEFEKWKGEISIDAEGTTENEVQDGNQDMLSHFVEYIKVIFSPGLDRFLLEALFSISWWAYKFYNWSPRFIFVCVKKPLIPNSVSLITSFIW